MLIRDYEPREKLDKRFYKAMEPLRNIGNNLNQLTAKAHSPGVVDAPMLREETLKWARFQAKIEAEFLRPVKKEDNMIETKLKISELHPLHDHPYKVLDDEEMTALVESVRENGILSPLIVFPNESGGYEVISGHRHYTQHKRQGFLKFLPWSTR